MMNGTEHRELWVSRLIIKADIDFLASNHFVTGFLKREGQLRLMLLLSL